MTTSAPGGFAMVPAWLAWGETHPDDVVVYVHLALHGTFNMGAGTYEQCRPSKRTLADGDPDRGYAGTGLSESSITRALRRLEARGAIVREEVYDPRTGARRPNVYRLQFGQIGQPVDPRVTDDQGGVSPSGQDEIPAQPPMSEPIPPQGYRDDRAPVSEPIPPQGYFPDTQPITRYPEPDTQTPSSPHADPPLDGLRQPGVGESQPQNQDPPTGPGDAMLAAATRTLDAILDGVPKHRQPSGTSRDMLVERLVICLEAGWRRPDLVDSLNASFRTAGSVARVLATRIGKLGPPPPSLPPRPVVAATPPRAIDDDVDPLADGRLEAEVARDLIRQATAGSSRRTRVSAAAS